MNCYHCNTHNPIYFQNIYTGNQLNIEIQFVLHDMNIFSKEKPKTSFHFLTEQYNDLLSSNYFSYKYSYHPSCFHAIVAYFESYSDLVII
jgi:hypothetical protein